MIIFTEKQLTQIYDHALTTYPEECCGILLGNIDKDFQVKKVIEIWATENSWENNPENLLLFKENSPQTIGKKNRFTIAPEILFQAQKYARDQELAIIGIYHSHPDASAIPSEFDRSIAWANYSYPIISVSQKKVNQVKSWSLDHTDQFQPEKMLIIKHLQSSS